jgi:hypothetical protein
MNCTHKEHDEISCMMSKMSKYDIKPIAHTITLKVNHKSKWKKKNSTHLHWQWKFSCSSHEEISIKINKFKHELWNFKYNTNYTLVTIDKVSN